MTKLDRTKDNPRKLKTPPGSSEYTMHVDEKDGVKILVCTVGKTVLHYDARCIDDLHAMLKTAGDWVELGGADEQKPAKDGNCRGVGPFSEESDKGMVWVEERSSRPLWCLCPASDGSAGTVRA